MLVITFLVQELKSEGSTVTLSLVLPADFPVGKYQVVAEVVPQGSRQGVKRDCNKDIVVLFNPWAQGMYAVLVTINYTQICRGAELLFKLEQNALQ